MSRFHRHGEVLPVPANHPDRGMPPYVYGRLVGVVNGPLSNVDANHVFVPLRVWEGPAKGTHRVAFNIESNAPPHAAEYCALDEPVAAADLPPEGFTEHVRLSYREFGVTQQQFRVVENGTLRALVHSSIARAQRVAVYGFTFPGGGIHDIHYNNGEPPGSPHPNRPGQDGALAVYLRGADNGYVRRWILIKFQTQTL